MRRMPQAMLNRISFLRSEEAKLDRDIDVAKRRALELLSRKAEKAEKVQDAELAATAKDILEVVGPTVQTGKGPLRPTTGEAWQVVARKGFGLAEYGSSLRVSAFRGSSVMRACDTWCT